MKRWLVALYACDGSRSGTLSEHWTRRGAARRRRIEEADDRKLNQLLGSRWVVERVGKPPPIEVVISVDTSAFEEAIGRAKDAVDALGHDDGSTAQEEAT